MGYSCMLFHHIFIYRINDKINSLYVQLPEHLQDVLKLNTPVLLNCLKDVSLYDGHIKFYLSLILTLFGSVQAHQV